MHKTKQKIILENHESISWHLNIILNAPQGSHINWQQVVLEDLHNTDTAVWTTVSNRDNMSERTYDIARKTLFEKYVEPYLNQSMVTEMVLFYVQEERKTVSTKALYKNWKTIAFLAFIDRYFNGYSNGIEQTPMAAN